MCVLKCKTVELHRFCIFFLCDRINKDLCVAILAVFIPVAITEAGSAVPRLVSTPFCES